MTADLHLRALYDADAFAEEQARLGQVWTLVGYASDIPRENDWFRAVLGGRSVFIQRFGEGLRGFENRCAHRSYPLRTKERGKGPILCGFHNWRYNAAGAAVGIPNCPDAFGTTPAGLGKSLVRLDVECCGDLIFARFPGGTESLEAFLGSAFEVLALLCANMRNATHAKPTARSNWRLSQWISMDDYHLAAVHPKSFGRKSRYLPKAALNYQRVGVHSAYFLGSKSGSMSDWVAQLRSGDPANVGYRIIHLFPNASIAVVSFIVLHFLRSRVVVRFPLMFPLAVLHRHVPLGVDRSRALTTVLRPEPERYPQTLWSWLTHFLARPFLWGIRSVTLRILREDLGICENLQRHAHQIAPDPLYGASEIRVAWFNEAYAEAMRAAEPPP